MHCQFNISNYSIAVYNRNHEQLQYSRLSSLKRVFGAVRLCYRDYKSEISSIIIALTNRIAV